MKIINNFLILSLFLTTSCKESGPHPSDMVGTYEVKARLKEGTIDKNAIKEEIRSAMDKAKEDIEKAKDDINNDLDLSAIDTSTLDGKLEYAAKSFSKSMTDAGLEIGNLTNDFGQALSGIAESGLNFSENILKVLNIQVELQADGDIKSKNGIFNMGLSNAKWEIKDNQFILLGQGSSAPESMKILKRDASGFSVEKDNLILDFVKKQ